MIPNPMSMKCSFASASIPISEMDAAVRALDILPFGSRPVPIHYTFPSPIITAVNLPIPSLRMASSPLECGITSSSRTTPAVCMSK